MFNTPLPELVVAGLAGHLTGREGAPFAQQAVSGSIAVLQGMLALLGIDGIEKAKGEPKACKLLRHQVPALGRSPQADDEDGELDGGWGKGLRHND